MCITRQFKQKKYLHEHVVKAQCGRIIVDRRSNTRTRRVGNKRIARADKTNMFGTRSLKQRTFMKELQNIDNFVGEIVPLVTGSKACLPEASYLSRSASIIREDLRVSPSWKANEGVLRTIEAHIDEHVTILLDGTETRYILKKDAAGFHKFGGHAYCTPKVLSMILRAIISCDNVPSYSAALYPPPA